MTGEEEPPLPKRGMALYAHLAGNVAANPSTTYSSEPVVYNQQNQGETTGSESSAKKPISNAALQFIPTRRPQPKSQKAKSKVAHSRVLQSSSKPEASSAALSSTDADQPPAPKPTLEDFMNNDEEVLIDYRPERGGARAKRRKQKQKDEEKHNQIINWDEPYDPFQPTAFSEYINGTDAANERLEWREHVQKYRHENKQPTSEEHNSFTVGTGADEDQHTRTGAHSSSDVLNSTEMEMAPTTAPVPPDTQFGVPAEPIVDISADLTGDDVYARRMRMSGFAPQHEEAKLEASKSPSAEALLSESTPDTATISRAPVRYNISETTTDLNKDQDSDIDIQDVNPEDDSKHEGEDEDAQPRSNRPGQKGFAARMMAKMGWTEGSGLGAANDGIIKPLSVQVEKAKRKPDSEGGGFVSGPSSKGKIVGGKKAKTAQAPGTSEEEADFGEFGRMSDVIILRGMVDNLDLDAEMAKDNGGIMQEIGDECDKYGRVERIYIHRGVSPAVVFVKFVEQVSALRAVNALHKRVFGGNTITAKYFDGEKFEAGVFE